MYDLLIKLFEQSSVLIDLTFKVQNFAFDTFLVYI